MQPAYNGVESGERDVRLGGQLIDRRAIASKISEFTRISNGKAAWAILRQWLVIAACIAAAIWIHHWTAYLLAAIIIATRQHALAVIMHDATHYRLFSNRSLGNVVSDLCCAFPIGFTTNLYRKQHIAHHRFTNTNDDPYWVTMAADPDWTWPKSQWDCFLLFLYDLVGVHIAKMLKFLSKWSPWPRIAEIREPDLYPAERWRFIGFAVFLIVFLTVTGGWFYYLILWVLPSLTLLSALVRIRSIAEHLVLDNEHELNASRHVDGTLLERLSIAPLGINYHIAHHMFPAVPFYNLPKLHNRLLNDPTYRGKAAILPNYSSFRNGVLSEMIHEFRCRRVDLPRVPVESSPSVHESGTKAEPAASRFYSRSRS